MSSDVTADEYDVHDAAFDLYEIVDRVEQGEEIVISRDGTPVAKIVPVTPRA